MKQKRTTEYDYFCDFCEEEAEADFQCPKCKKHLCSDCAIGTNSGDNASCPDCSNLVELEDL
jgi:hypothetical protein